MKFPALFAPTPNYDGMEVTKGAVAPMTVANSPGLVGNGGWFGGILGIIQEAFAGAWQSNITVDGTRSVLAFSAVFAVVTGIAGDVAKLAVDLKQIAGNIGVRVDADSPYWRVLKKPNRHQTRMQFVEQWLLSKLLYGNTYALKERDGNGMVCALYILDAQRVKALVASNGDVYYELHTDFLSGVTANVIVPSREIIHDRWNCLWHPLVGVSPLYAAALSATQGNRIQQNSTRFFENMSRPAGMLLAPGKIEEPDAIRLKLEWEKNFGGQNIGRLAVLGSGMKYEAMAVPAQTAQLIEQLRWTGEDCARPFHYPMFKITGAIPVGSTVEALNAIYLSDCLHPLIEALETCLDDGLELAKSSPPYYTECNLRGLLRMDQTAQAAVLTQLVKGTVMAPNEAREEIDLPAVKGGESPMGQHQDYSLAALAKRDASDDPFGTAKPPPAAPPVVDPPAVDPGAAKAIEDGLRAIAEADAAMRAKFESAERAMQERSDALDRRIAELEESARLEREAAAARAKDVAFQDFLAIFAATVDEGLEVMDAP